MSNGLEWSEGLGNFVLNGQICTRKYSLKFLFKQKIYCKAEIAWDRPNVIALH